MSFESFGTDGSRCFDTLGSGILRPLCLSVECTDYGGAVAAAVTVGSYGETVICEVDGQVVYLPGSADVRIECPPLEILCPGYDACSTAQRLHFFAVAVHFDSPYNASHFASHPQRDPSYYCPANCAGRGICRHGVVNGCECFDPNDTSPHCANSPIIPPTPAPPITTEYISIGGVNTDVLESGALLDDAIDDNAPAEIAESGDMGADPSFEESFADDSDQDTLTIFIGSPATTSTVPDNAGTPNGGEEGQSNASSFSVDPMKCKGMFLLIQISVLVTWI